MHANVEAQTQAHTFKHKHTCTRHGPSVFSFLDVTTRAKLCLDFLDKVIDLFLCLGS
jgi:hypothetical protein